MKQCKFNYVVVRHTLDRKAQLCYNAHVLDSFRTYEAAIDCCDAYKQQLIDAGLGDKFRFDVQMSSYYDE